MVLAVTVGTWGTTSIVRFHGPISVEVRTKDDFRPGGSRKQQQQRLYLFF